MRALAVELLVEAALRRDLRALGALECRHLEHLECGHQPHAQDRGAEKRTQLAGRSASGYGLESPSPGGARSQGHNTGLRGLVLRFGFPLAAERPLYSELKNTLRGLDPRTRFPLNCKACPFPHNVQNRRKTRGRPSKTYSCTCWGRPRACYHPSLTRCTRCTDKRARSASVPTIAARLFGTQPASGDCQTDRG